MRGLTALIAVVVVGLAATSTADAVAESSREPEPETLANTTPSGPAEFLGPIKRVPVGKIELAYRQFGEGPDLVLVIGQAVAMTAWDLDLLEQLAASWRVTVFDNRGVGGSTTDATPLTIPLMADDTAGLIRVLGLRKPAVVGWSMGGEIALALLAGHPRPVGRVVVSGATPGSRHAVSPSSEVIRQLANPDTPPEVFLELIFPPTASAAASAYGLTFVEVPQEDVSPEIIAAQSKAEERFVRSNLVWDALPKLGKRLLVTAGAEDEIVPPANARRIARRTKARLEVFAGAGHAMLFQDASRFVDLVNRFARPQE